MTTHDNWFSPPRSLTIVGSAVATIVWSSDAINIPHDSRTCFGGEGRALLMGWELGQDCERSHFALEQSLPIALRRVYADVEPAVSQRGRNERNETTT